MNLPSKTIEACPATKVGLHITYEIVHRECVVSCVPCSLCCTCPLVSEYGNIPRHALPVKSVIK